MVLHREVAIRQVSTQIILKSKIQQRELKVGGIGEEVRVKEQEEYAIE